MMMMKNKTKTETKLDLLKFVFIIDTFNWWFYDDEWMNEENSVVVKQEE